MISDDGCWDEPLPPLCWDPDQGHSTENGRMDGRILVYVRFHKSQLKVDDTIVDTAQLKKTITDTERVHV